MEAYVIEEANTGTEDVKFISCQVSLARHKTQVKELLDKNKGIIKIHVKLLREPIQL